MLQGRATVNRRISLMTANAAAVAALSGAGAADNCISGRPM